MLNILRKLRRTEMKSGQYIKYAIGEIFLVMVGILLALGISNWNEERKAGIAEVEYMQSLIKDVRSDSIFYQSRKLGLSGSNKDYDGLLKMAQNQEHSLTTNSLRSIFQFYAHQSKVVTNHPMVFETISDSEVTRSLRAYFGTYEYVSIAMTIYNDALKAHFFPFSVKHSHKINNNEDLIPNLVKLIKTTELHGITNLLRDYSLNALEQVDSMIVVNQSLIVALDQKLKD